jgi:hypothetical protein
MLDLSHQAPDKFFSKGLWRYKVAFPEPLPKVVNRHTSEIVAITPEVVWRMHGAIFNAVPVLGFLLDCENTEEPQDTMIDGS